MTDITLTTDQARALLKLVHDVFQASAGAHKPVAPLDLFAEDDAAHETFAAYDEIQPADVLPAATVLRSAASTLACLLYGDDQAQRMAGDIDTVYADELDWLASGLALVNIDNDEDKPTLGELFSWTDEYR